MAGKHKRKEKDFVLSCDDRIINFVCQQVEDEIHILCTKKYAKVVISVTDGPRFEIDLQK